MDTRPYYHFTTPHGWLNDPNGLVYVDGKYHLFYQHNPREPVWAPDLCWGHAISTDLFHWQPLPSVLPARALPGGGLSGSWSGSAVIDKRNSSGLGSLDKPPVMLFFTATGIGQCMAFSLDKGLSFRLWPENPVLPFDDPANHDWDRDPRVFYYEPDKIWIMVISKTGKGFFLYRSHDLKSWVPAGSIPGLFECPDMFQLPVDGDKSSSRWVVHDASGKYYVGRFNGFGFRAEGEPQHVDYGSSYYAAQSWSNAPLERSRRISIAWMRGSDFPGAVYSQQLSVPCELTLRTSPNGIRLFRYPVRELRSLRHESRTWRSRALTTGSALRAEVAGPALDIELELTVSPDARLYLDCSGSRLEWSDG
ncbi:MAG TPA: glycoside hydrolase family 32 protein, partial [Chthonomonadales bacterium]|nr:glycoside hydrolase family 32 protein [Chthonomonadales bacterium]